MTRHSKNNRKIRDNKREILQSLQLNHPNLNIKISGSLDEFFVLMPMQEFDVTVTFFDCL